MLYKFGLIAVAGGLGSVARYGTGLAVHHYIGNSFPWGTFAVNAVGCLIFGFVSGLAVHRLPLPEEMRLLVLVGFCGAYTTFSTFAFDAMTLFESERYAAFFGYVLLNNLVGLALMFGGFLATRPLAAFAG